MPLSNIYTNSSIDGIGVDVTIGSGENRKVILMVMGGNAIVDQWTPAIDGTNMTQIFSYRDTAEYNIRTTLWEMLDADLPASGTYTINDSKNDTSGNSTFVFAFYAEGFTQESASIYNTSTDSGTSASLTIGSPTGSYLALSGFLGEGDMTPITSGQDTDIQTGDTFLHEGSRTFSAASSYTIDGDTTQTYSLSASEVFIMGGAAFSVIEAEVVVPTSQPKVMLDISGNNRTFDMTQPWRSMGELGEYDTRIIWRRLGQYRSFTPRIRISHACPRAVYTAYVEIEPCR